MTTYQAELEYAARLLASSRPAFYNHNQGGQQR